MEIDVHGYKLEFCAKRFSLLVYFVWFAWNSRTVSQLVTEVLASSHVPSSLCIRSLIYGAFLVFLQMQPSLLSVPSLLTSKKLFITRVGISVVIEIMASENDCCHTATFLDSPSVDVSKISSNLLIHNFKLFYKLQNYTEIYSYLWSQSCTFVLHQKVATLMMVFNLLQKNEKLSFRFRRNWTNSSWKKKHTTYFRM